MVTLYFQHKQALQHHRNVYRSAVKELRRAADAPTASLLSCVAMRLSDIVKVGSLHLKRQIMTLDEMDEYQEAHRLLEHPKDG